MVFLIEVNFGKVSKIGTTLSKRKFGNFDTFVGNSINFMPLFPQLRFYYPIVSTLRSMEVFFIKKFLFYRSFLMSNRNSRKMSGANKNFRFCIQFLAIFQRKSANFPSKVYWIMCSVFVERLTTF